MSPTQKTLLFQLLTPVCVAAAGLLAYAALKIAVQVSLRRRELVSATGARRGESRVPRWRNANSENVSSQTRSTSSRRTASLSAALVRLAVSQALLVF